MADADFLVSSDPKLIPNSKYIQFFCRYIEERQFTELEELLLKICGLQEHSSFEVTCDDLVDFDPSLGYSIIHHPKLLIPLFNEGLMLAQHNLCSHPDFAKQHGRKGTTKKHCHIRITSLPPTDYLNKSTISDIRADDIDSLIQISGKVVRTGAVRMLEVSKTFECQHHRCQHRFDILADPERDNMFIFPKSCPRIFVDENNNNDSQNNTQNNLQNSSNRSNSDRKCQSTNVRELEGCKVCVDYQELKIQDSFERVTLGSIPRSIVVILESDLVDKFNAGSFFLN